MVHLVDPKDETGPLLCRLDDAIESVAHAAGDFIDERTTRISGSDDAFFLSRALQQLRRIEGELIEKFPLSAIAGEIVSTAESLVWRLKKAVDEIEEAVYKFTKGDADSIRGIRNRERLASSLLTLRGIHSDLERLFPYKLKTG